MKTKIHSVFLMLILIASMTACKPIQNATNGLIEKRVTTVVIKNSGVTPLVAQCKPGEQMMGGGFNMIASTEDVNIVVLSNYPSGPLTWTVEVKYAPKPVAGSEIKSIPAFAYAYCYTGDKQLGMEINKSVETETQSNVRGVNFASCDCRPGSIVTSGGFKLIAGSSNPQQIGFEERLFGSYPSLDDGIPNGWTTSNYWENNGTDKVETYVMCSNGSGSTPALTVDNVVTSNATLPTISPIGIASGDAVCKNGFYTTGGGFNYNVPTDEVSGPATWFAVRTIYMSEAAADQPDGKAGIFYGWRFNGYLGSPGLPISVYSLQLQVK